ncbi:hypothetical protein GCM10010371_54070 [Streptomyces subrutilus]|uniref:Uncharacterized protein n=1 Tax=Streptomyces subrutilus TaxID=36818 RepID=A0A5P2UX77_9ACTN|nr:hypothetical protein CP968_26530 [Streptomyces subrutilus]GGZ87401.1 hypothetical protein GCM10010371_54070 [Streptomyces subrutilus]
MLNRNENEVMCRAYDDSDGEWIVNPMSIEPKPRKTDPYPCSTTGRIGRDGAPGPVRRDDAGVIPDQADRVHPPARRDTAGQRP